MSAAPCVTRTAGTRTVRGAVQGAGLPCLVAADWMCLLVCVLRVSPRLSWGLVDTNGCVLHTCFSPPPTCFVGRVASACLKECSDTVDWVREPGRGRVREDSVAEAGQAGFEFSFWSSVTATCSGTFWDTEIEDACGHQQGEGPAGPWPLHDRLRSRGVLEILLDDAAAGLNAMTTHRPSCPTNTRA